MVEHSDQKIQRLQALLHSLASRSPINQALIALESMDQSFRWIGATGAAHPDGTPLRADTPFFIASIDKLFNATIIMKLSEDNRLDLEAPMSTYLPPALTRGLHRLAGVDHSDQITVRHLLSHSSGLADWLEDRPPGEPSLVDRVLQEGDRAFELEHIIAMVRDRLKPHFPPQNLAGHRYKVRYSDTNYILLIAIIEAVSGEPLHQVHERLLLRPLDLRHTHFVGRSQPLDPTPEPVLLRAGGQPLHIPLLLRSTWGIYSTAADTLTFLRHFVRGQIFRNPDTMAAMQARWNRFGFPLDRVALRSPGWPIEYGLGLMRFRLPRLFTPLHPLPPVLGHTGSTGCWLFYCPRWEMLLTGSVDEGTAGAVPYRIVPKILNILRASDR